MTQPGFGLCRAFFFDLSSAQLVGTCRGNHKNRTARPGFHQHDANFLCTLADARVRPEEVDYVMCTHLHWTISVGTRS